MNEFNISCYIDAKTYMDFAKFHRFKTNKSIFNLFFFPMLLIIFALFNLLLHNNWIAILLVCLASIIPCWTLGLFYLETNAKIRDMRSLFKALMLRSPAQNLLLFLRSSFFGKSMVIQ